MESLRAASLRDLLMSHLYVITTPLDGSGQHVLTCGCGRRFRGPTELYVQQDWAEHVRVESNKPTPRVYLHDYVPL